MQAKVKLFVCSRCARCSWSVSSWDTGHLPSWILSPLLCAGEVPGGNNLQQLFLQHPVPTFKECVSFATITTAAAASVFINPGPPGLTVVFLPILSTGTSPVCSGMCSVATWLIAA